MVDDPLPNNTAVVAVRRTKPEMTPSSDRIGVGRFARGTISLGHTTARAWRLIMGYMKLGHNNEAPDRMGSPHLAPRTRDHRTLGTREECTADPLYDTPAQSSVWREACYGSNVSPARGRMGLKGGVRTFGRGWRFVAHYDRSR